jgi:hypothetical protein
MDFRLSLAFASSHGIQDVHAGTTESMSPTAARLTSDPRIGELLDIFVGRLIPSDKNLRDYQLAALFQIQYEDHLRHVTDWIVADVERNAPWLHRLNVHGQPLKLAKITTIDAAVKEADKAMKRAADVLRATPGYVEPTHEKLFEDLGEGWSLVELASPAALDKESAMMGHCIGNGAYDTLLGTRRYLSLRGSNGRSHATLELEGNVLLQLKGKQNSMPVRRYMEMLIPVIEREGWHLQEKPYATGYVQEVSGKLHPLDDLPDGLRLRSMDLSFTTLARMPCDLVVVGSLIIGTTSIVALPENLHVGGDFSMAYSSIGGLAPGLVVEGDLDVSYTNVRKLPSDLRVRGSIRTSGTGIPDFDRTRRDADGYIDLSPDEHETSLRF